MNLLDLIKDIPRIVQTGLIVFTIVCSTLLPTFENYSRLRKDLDIRVIKLEKDLIEVSGEVKVLQKEIELKKLELEDCKKTRIKV